MSAPYNNIRSKHNRAIVAYLISQGIGSNDDTTPANSVGSNTYPRTTVRSMIAKPNPNHTGDYRITTHISIKGTATNKANEPNPEQARVEFDKRVGQTCDALMMTDNNINLKFTASSITTAGRALAVAIDASGAAILFAANNADMADYTCDQWYDGGSGDGEPDEQGTAFEEILIFEAVCWPSATS